MSTAPIWAGKLADGGDKAWIEVEISEKGWGTGVRVTAENDGGATKLEGWLEAVMDEFVYLEAPVRRDGSAASALPIYSCRMATRPGEKPKLDSDADGDRAAKDAVEEDLHRHIAPVASRRRAGDHRLRDRDQAAV